MLSFAVAPLTALQTPRAPAPKAVAISKTEFCYGSRNSLERPRCHIGGRATHGPSTDSPMLCETCAGLPGNIAPAGDFDPANLLEGVSKEEVYRWREAELAHGRVGMLAAAGFLVQENFHPLFSGDGGPAIEQIPALPPAIWFLMTLGVGIAEAYRIQVGWANPYEDDSGKIGRTNSAKVQTLRDDYYPGDLRFDPLGLAPTNQADFRVMQEKELSHGRSRCTARLTPASSPRRG